MNSEALALFIEFALQTVFLIIPLWIMIRIQRLNQDMQYRFWKVMIAAAIASGLDLIPHFGHYLSGGVLLVLIARITRADSVDVLFTVAVSYALMFGLNLWLLGALLGDLRMTADDAESEPTAEIQPQEAGAATALPLHATNSVASVLLSTNLTRDSATNVTTAQTTGKPANQSPTNATAQTSNPNTTPTPAVRAKPAKKVPVTRKPKPPVASIPAAATRTPRERPKTPQEVARGLALKGLFLSANPEALIESWQQIQAVAPGKSFPVETAAGEVLVLCEEITTNRVRVSVAGERVWLSLEDVPR